MTAFAFMASSCALKIPIAEIFNRKQNLPDKETDKKRQRYEKNESGTNSRDVDPPGLPTVTSIPHSLSRVTQRPRLAASST